MSEINLVMPSSKYIERILGSKHFLNCPKHMLNHDLDCIYRQFIGYKIEKLVIEHIADYLKNYSIAKPIETATKFFEWRSKISIIEFNKINVNSYIDNPPKHIEKILKRQSEWIDKNTKYRHGEIIYVPSYPYRYN